MAEKNKKINEKMLEKLDVNGDGRFDVEDVIISSMRVPGVRIDRSKFLQKELLLDCSSITIDDAIKTTPALAGIPSDIIDKHVDDVIKFERNCVSGISTALSIPGGFAMAATIPADIAQYYGYMLRAAQKIMYLYGFPDVFDGDDEFHLDSATMNSLILCLGVMYGVAGANNAIKAMAKCLGKGVQKQLMRRALTKGTVYPIVKSIAKWFSIKMTKEVFSTFFEKSIPVVGGVIGGGLTYLSFKPCCDKLKKTLCNTQLSNPNYDAPLDDDVENIVNQIMEEAKTEEE